MMSALRSDNQQNSAGERLRSQTDQQTGPNVLSPLSDKLPVDGNLKLSNENFKRLIENYFNINADRLSQIKATPRFPTPHVFAHLASKTYTDYKEKENDAQDEKRLELPKGWKILTTASNSTNGNGYFGAAYWHPEHQQVVIAHRGTDPKNVGALWTDLKGVLLNHYVRQMESASTFAHKVVEVLQNINKRKGVNFQLFYTGHSLGGWLAQITTFTTNYLKVENETFRKSDNIPQSFYPHTVVFDSPGCQDMLSQMTTEFDVRLDGRSIDIEQLDITSYLSAPNRINTCNKHVGTVYRIFPDFSKISWLKKHTAFYTFEAHSMQKIVDFFNRREGQIHKDEQCRQKILLAVDWPISAGLRRGKEYKRFFKGATHLNEYHQEVTDVTIQVKGYGPLRYQTKTYDERVCRLSVFRQEEKLFLERYLWLRQLPEFFKPKELFSVMEDNEAQKQAEEILKCFKFENEETKNKKVRCADGSALQALIAYVKRLLQLFPEINESTRNALSSDGVRNRVYQIETTRYIKRIDQSPLDFNSDASSLRDFVRSDKQQVLQLQLVDGDEWTGLIRLYQGLKKTNCLIEGQYTILKLKRLLTVNRLMNFSPLMLSTETPHLLLMACDTNQLLNDEEQQIIRTIFNTIKQKQNIKVFLSTRSEVTKSPSVQEVVKDIFGKAFVTTVEHFTWNDLTTFSKEKLLQNSATFQGVRVPLNELMSAESTAAQFLQLDVLLEGKELKIADPVPNSNGYKERYYIGRTFNHQTTINEYIFNDRAVTMSYVYRARSEQEFQQICQRNPISSVHLQLNESGNLLWISQGRLETLRRYVNPESSQTYTNDDLDQLLEQAEFQGVMVISDKAGMGKSTVLAHLAKQIKQTSPAKWVVRIDLNDHTDVLDILEKEQIDSKKAIDIVSTKLLKLKRGLELELFKQGCKQNQKVRIVIMLDGFDEVSPDYKETVIDLLQALRETAVEQLWVTTRPHLRNYLEDKLQQLSYTLEPFSEQDQIEFLTNFWSQKEWFTDLDSKKEEDNNKKLEIYARELIKKLAQSICDKEREFTGIPLQTRMLAEAFEKEVKTFCRSNKSMPELPFRLELLDLYERFIERKYDIYQEEKLRAPLTNVAAKDQRKLVSNSMRKVYQLLALEVLFNSETVKLFQDNRKDTYSAEELNRFGLAQVNSETKPHFIHRTFAEYHVANYLMKHLTKGNNTSEQVQTFVLTDIFLREDYQVIRVFIDGLLSRSDTSEVLKQYGNRIHELGECGVRILHQSVRECNTNIITFLLDSVEAGGHTDTLNELLLNQDGKGETAWHKAAWGGNIQVLEKLYAYADRKLTTEEVNNKLLLAKEKEGQTAWHFAAERENLNILEKLWEWATKKLTAEDLNNKLLLGRDIKGKTAWHVAADRGKLQVLQMLWVWAKEVLTTQELKNELLLGEEIFPRTYKCRYKKNHTSTHNTALHSAARLDRTELFLKIWEWNKEELTTEEIKNEVLLAEDNWKQIFWHIVARNGNSVLLETLWEWARENLTTEELNKKLLFAKDDMERTAFHTAAIGGKTEVLEKMWEWSKEIQTAEEINKLLLLAKDGAKETAFHCAVRGTTTKALQKIWEWGKEKLTAEEIKSTFLLADIDEKLLYIAAGVGHREVLRKIWAWAKEELTAKELIDQFFLAKSQEQTAFHVAASLARLDTLQELWERAKENLTKEELIDKLLLAKDSMGRTAWHDAAEKGHTEVLEMLWELAKEELTPEQLNKNLLLGKDYWKRTAWHLAAGLGNIKSLLKLWEWAKKELTTEELHNSFLLATDDKDHTAWHLAIDWGRSEILQGIWDCAKKELNPEKLYNELLLAKFDGKTTAWHVTANVGNVKILEKLWEWAKDTHTAENLNNNLLLARDRKERTAFHVATLRNGTEVVEKLWEFANEETTTAEVNKNMLLATENEGLTAWHIAVFRCYNYLFEQLWQWAKEKLSADELKYKLCLVKHEWGRTAWHDAAEVNNTEVLDILWEWGKEELTPEMLRNGLLLAKDDNEGNAWHLAAKMGNTESLEKIWKRAKSELSTEELNDKFLLAKDSQEMTAWHVAADCDKTESLQKIWEWAKQELTAEDLKSRLLLAKDNREMTAFDVALRNGKFDVLEILQQWAVEELTPEELSNISCLSTNVVN